MHTYDFTEIELYVHAPDLMYVHAPAFYWFDVRS